MPPSITIDRDAVGKFCRHWKIAELRLFGSVLRADFGPGSDIDVLATFRPDADWSLFDHAAMQEELSAILGRRADLVSRRGVERSRNWIRRRAILSESEPIYADG